MALSHQRWWSLLEAVQQISLRQAEAFAVGLPAKDALHAERGAWLGPQPYTVVVGLQPLIAVWADGSGAERGTGPCGVWCFWRNKTPLMLSSYFLALTPTWVVNCFQQHDKENTKFTVTYRISGFGFKTKAFFSFGKPLLFWRKPSKFLINCSSIYYCRLSWHGSMCVCVFNPTRQSTAEITLRL